MPNSKDIALPQLAITLVFWRKFGAPHWHKYSDTERDIRFHIDTNLVGRTVVFIPTLSRKSFEIGRAAECWLRLGYNPDSKRDPTITEDVYDDGGALAQPLFNHWSRKHATFELITRQRAETIAGDWYIYPGGEFWNTVTGVREWGDATNFVYLEGRRLSGGHDPTPLFTGDNKLARVQLGDAGKIIIYKGRLGSHTTSWPDDIWAGNGWPDMVSIANARVAAAQSEVQTAKVIRDADPLPSHSEVTGRTMADVLTTMLNGPDNIDRRLLWAGYGALAALLLWLWER